MVKRRICPRIVASVGNYRTLRPAVGTHCNGALALRAGWCRIVGVSGSARALELDCETEPGARATGDWATLNNDAAVVVGRGSADYCRFPAPLEQPANERKDMRPGPKFGSLLKRA